MARIRLVAAIAENGVIGRGGTVPWRLAADLRHFRAITMGKPVVMGRRTWQSLPKKPLDGRHNIIVTSDPTFSAPGADVAPSPQAALALARAGGADEICVIGGAQLYAATLPLADFLDITHVLAEIDGDTRFPAIDPARWRAVLAEDMPAGAGDDHPARRVVYERAEQTVSATI